MAKKTLKIRGEKAEKIRRSAGHAAKKNSRKILLIVVFLLAIGAGVFLVAKFNLFGINDLRQQNSRNQQLGISDKKVTDQEKAQHKVAKNLPRFLNIEKIGVKNARMMSVGVMTPDANGGQQMEAVDGVHDVGWYDCRKNPVAENRCSDPTIPGDGDTETAAILEGHSCSGKTECVFDRLNELKNGDKFTIETGGGEKITYIVKKSKTVALNDVDMNEMLTPVEKGKEGLNLMTCFGSWTEKDSHGVATMDQRVMIFAVRE